MAVRPGVREFQLFLLKLMEAPAAQTDDVLARLGATTADLAQSAEQVSPLMKPRPDFAVRLREILAEVGVVERDGALRSVLPAWPDLHFVVEFTGEMFLWRAAFTSPSGGRAIVPTPLSAWNLLIEQVPEFFTEVESVDAWGHYESFIGTLRSDGHRYFLRFAFGLLQEASAMNGTGDLDSCSRPGQKGEDGRAGL